ncbi:hypothetical protein BGX26_001937 [Mortierella sp. AD094]|nr:hypothetical protein BGX26_001937 [Mortierella sp. AD094]
MAITGVFAPTLPTKRMNEFISQRQLKNALGPKPELPNIEIYDANIMKAIRLYLKDKSGEAEVQSMPGNKKLRIMLESLPNTNSTTQKQQNLGADRPHLRAKLSGHKILRGEIAGPTQTGCRAKDLWDTFKLARFGKAFIVDGNDSAVSERT